MSRGGDNLKRIGQGMLPNAIWDAIKWAGGGSLVTSALSALWQKLQHGSLDWYFIVGLFAISFVVIFFIMNGRNKSLRSFERVLEDRFSEGRKKLEAQIPSFMVNGVPVAGPLLAAHEKAREEAANRSLGYLFSDLQIEAFEFAQQLRQFAAEQGGGPSPREERSRIDERNHSFRARKLSSKAEELQDKFGELGITAPGLNPLCHGNIFFKDQIEQAAQLVEKSALEAGAKMRDGK